MIGPRRHGTWAKVHESIDDHPKTIAAAEVLVAELGLPLDYAAAIVTRSIRRLVCWAIRESDAGRTAHLSDFQLVAIAWPAAIAPAGPLFGCAEVGVLRRALHAVPTGHAHGFLYLWNRGQGRAGVEHLHEFQWYAWAALRDRPHYKGSRLEDYEGAPYGASGETAAPTPTEAGAPPPPAAAADAGSSAEVAPRLRRSGAEVAAMLAGRSAAPAVRNPLQDRDRLRADAARTPRAIRSASAAEAAEDHPNPRARIGPGWSGIPAGVKAGDADAVAAFVRDVAPISHARLYPGSTYVERFRDVAGVVPPDLAGDAACPPGRALEALAPDAWNGLIADLVAHLPACDWPRKYAATALGQRWEATLGKAADAAAARRAQWRADRSG